MNAENKLLTFICENFAVEIDEIELDESLVEQGIVDSFGLVEISSFMSKEFAIEITSKDITKENFGSVKKMAAFSEARQKTKEDKLVTGLI